MASELDKFNQLLSELTQDIKGIKEKANILSKRDSIKTERVNDLEQKLIRAIEIYESEIKKRDDYIRALENKIVNYKNNMRYW